MAEHICSKSGLPMGQWFIGECPACVSDAGMTGDDRERFAAVMRAVAEHPDFWHHAPLLRRAAAAAEATEGMLDSISGLLEEAIGVLDRFGAPFEPGDTVADRITMLRDSYEHSLAAARSTPRPPSR